MKDGKNQALLWHTSSPQMVGGIIVERGQRGQGSHLKEGPDEASTLMMMYIQCGFCFSVVSCQSLNLFFLSSERETFTVNCNLNMCPLLTHV